MTAPADLTHVERLALGQIKRKRRSQGVYDRTGHRSREVDKLATARFGKVLPVDVDAAPYLTAIAYAANASDPDLVEAAVQGWCGRFAPHLLRGFADIFEPIRLSIEGRRWNISDHDAAHLLGVTFAERQTLGLVTIGACDLSPEQLKDRVAADRRDRERKRLAEKRAALRVLRAPREAWLATNAQEREAPWVALGISRRSYFRRKKDAPGTGVLQGAHDLAQVVLQGARDGVALVVLQTRTPHGGSDTPVPGVSIEPALLDLIGLSGDGAKPPSAACAPHRPQQETRQQPARQTTGMKAGLRSADQFELFPTGEMK